MVKIPRLHVLSDDDDQKEAHPLGVRRLRKSGGSVVVTIPPEVLRLTDMEVGNEVVVHVAEDSISLTRLPSEADEQADQ